MLQINQILCTETLVSLVEFNWWNKHVLQWFYFNSFLNPFIDVSGFLVCSSVLNTPSTADWTHHLHFVCIQCFHGDSRARPSWWRGTSSGAATPDALQPRRCRGPTQQHWQPRRQREPDHTSAGSGEPRGGRRRSLDHRQPSELCLNNGFGRYISGRDSPCRRFRGR